MSAETAPAEPRSKTARTALRSLVSLAVAALCLWLALRGVDFEHFREVVADPGWGLVTLAGILSLVVSAVHCTKIQVLMAPVRRLRFRTVFSAELVSIMVDIVLPMRLQELVRAVIIGRGEALPASLVLGVQVVEKAVEVPLLLALLLSLGLTRPLPPWAMSTVWVALVGAGLVVIMLGVVVVRPALLARPIRWLGTLQLPGAQRAAAEAGRVLEGMRLAATRPAAFAAIVLITAVEWSILAAALWLAAASIGVHLGGWELLGLLVVNFVAFAVPSSTSAAVGIYEFTGKTMMMMLFGMSAEQALAVVLMAHGTLIGFGVLGGLVGVVLAQVSLADVRSRLSAGSSPPADPVAPTTAAGAGSTSQPPAGRMPG